MSYTPSHIVDTRYAIIGGGTTGFFASYYMRSAGVQHVDIYEPNELGGRIGRSTDGWDHCVRLIPSLYHNAINILTDTGLNVEPVQMVTSSISVWDAVTVAISIVVALVLLCLNCSTETIHETIPLSTNMRTSWTWFLAVLTYTTDPSVMDRSAFIYQLCVFAATKIVSIPCYSPPYTCTDRWGPHIEALVHKWGYNVIQNRVTTIKRDPHDSMFVIHGQKYHQVLVCADIYTVYQLLLPHLPIDSCQYLERCVGTLSRRNGFPIFDMIVKCKPGTIVGQNIQAYKRPVSDTTCFIITKPLANMLYISCDRILSQDSIREHVLPSCGMDSSIIDSMRIRISDDVPASQRIFIGQRVQLNKLVLPNGIFLAGTYTDGSCTESAAISAKRAVRQMVLGTSRYQRQLAYVFPMISTISNWYY